MVKRLPAMQETRVRSLGCEDPLEKEMATHSSILAWRIPRTEEPGGATVHEVTRVRHKLTSKPPPLNQGFQHLGSSGITSWLILLLEKCCAYMIRHSLVSDFTTVAHQAPLSHGILQARILGWVTVHFSRGSSWPRDWTCTSCVSCIL